MRARLEEVIRSQSPFFLSSPSEHRSPLDPPKICSMAFLILLALKSKGICSELLAFLLVLLSSYEFALMKLFFDLRLLVIEASDEEEL